jgi:hypothetical protein
MKSLRWLVGIGAMAATFSCMTTPAEAADRQVAQSPDVICAPEDCGGGGGGGGWVCRNVSEDAYQDDGLGSYRMTITLRFCANGSTVANCQILGPEIYSHWWWYWEGWVTAPYTYGGGSSCSEYGQGHFKFARPGWFDSHDYPWIRITGYANGSSTTSEGGY